MARSWVVEHSVASMLHSASVGASRRWAQAERAGPCSKRQLGEENELTPDECHLLLLACKFKNAREAGKTPGYDYHLARHGGFST